MTTVNGTSEGQDQQDRQLSKKDIRKVEIFLLILAIINILFVIYIMIIGKPLDWLIMLMLTILTFAPAFVANAGMTIAGTIKRTSHPIDFGKNFIDGQRLFGEGKTIEGFVGGIIIGILVSPFILFLHYLAQVVATMEMNIYFLGSPLYYVAMKLITFEEFTRVLAVVPPTIAWVHFPRIILMSIGAAVGDLVGSFIKRRFKLPRGAQFPVVDQVDFICISILFTLPLFLMPFYFLPWYYYVLIIIFTPLIALFANFVAYKLGKKSVPW
ncbi:MAG: CDP-2,3-bis-(O-geranylgeranyl)-sn-glycerol synthase [Candidatus Helarchaeales archaeon]